MENKNIDSPHFHGKCKKRKHTTINKHGEGMRHSIIHDFWCLEHKVPFCKCGWEWGFHYGTNSKTLN